MRRLALLAVVLLLAACGADVSAPYSAKATKPCIVKLGWKASARDADVGVIAATAARGGLFVRVARRNRLTIAFGQSTRDAVGLAKAYYRFAPKKLKPHLRDVLERERNAILVWTVAPTARDLQDAVHCLS